MRKPFDQWAQQEILRLRAEADALERALHKYLRSEPAPAINEDAQVTAFIESDEKGARRGHMGRPAGSRSKEIFGFIRNSSQRGATLKDVYGFAEERGFKMATNSIRSVLWYAKKSGRIIERDGRYFDRPIGLGPISPSPPRQSAGAA
jgi:hypothetical protein